MSRLPYDAVSFDFFGTLAAGDAAAVRGVCDAVIHDLPINVSPESFGQRWSRAFFEEMAGSNHGNFKNIFECECRSLERVVADLGHKIQADPYVEPVREYCQNPPLHDEALEVIDQLKGHVQVCIVSNADEEDLQAAVRARGLSVDAVITSELTRSYKPDRRIFDEALSLLGVAPQRCLHVGDSRHSDIGGAAAAGLGTAWIARSERIGDVHGGGPEPDYTIRCLRELTAFVVES